ncbi:MAG TPA: hypothetical protein VH641_06955 [Streptosporangiaceae bacterium]|jgi:hypothetical protein
MQVRPNWAGQEERQRREQPPPEGGGAGESLPSHGFGGRGEGGLGFRRSRGAAKARRTRLQRYIWGGAVVVVAAIVTVTLLELGGKPKPKVTIPGLVTTFQPGELKTVPSACSSVPAATLSQSMLGKPTSLAPRPLNGKAQSVCDWTVDAPPVYRHMEVTVQAYAPSGLATGNGSATNAATDAYQQAMQQKIKPPRSTHMPKATITQPGHMGTQAFAALQLVRSGGNATYLESVVTRFHNVLVTVVLQGSHTGRYGPVNTTQLYGGAVAVARDVLARLSRPPVTSG